MQRTSTRPTLSIARRPGLDQFYLVWAENRRAPRKRWAMREDAVAEADRLSQINPGINYHVYVARRVAMRKVTP